MQGSCAQEPTGKQSECTTSCAPEPVIGAREWARPTQAAEAHGWGFGASHMQVAVPTNQPAGRKKKKKAGRTWVLLEEGRGIVHLAFNHKPAGQGQLISAISAVPIGREMAWPGIVRRARRHTHAGANQWAEWQMVQRVAMRHVEGTAFGGRPQRRQ